MNDFPQKPDTQNEKKTWTVIVYLAAGDNLEPFGIDTLRQLQAAASPNMHVVAEFDTGPKKQNRRFYFNGKGRFGSITENEVKRFGPVSAGNPKNLKDFITWSVSQYPAKHYFLVIWGHGAGVDDSIHQIPDNSFVPRHPLLSMFKGILNIPQKTILNAPADETPKILTGLDMQRDFGGIETALIAMAKAAVTNALSTEAMRITGQKTNGEAFKLDPKALDSLRSEIMTFLTKQSGSLKSGPLAPWQRAIEQAGYRGLLAAFESGIFEKLKREVAYSLSRIGKSTNGHAHKELLNDSLRTILQNGFLLTLQNSITQALQMQNLSPSIAGIAGVKSLAYVDDPTAYITNVSLKEILREATRELEIKIDILGMDSCNMNMIEIGYELRDSVRFFVASQDNVPDASWPYDRILHYLAEHDDVAPKVFAVEIPKLYVDSYKDYESQEVTLSTLDLGFSPEMAGVVAELTATLKKDPDSKNEIASVRKQVQNFGENQFVDFIHFCQLLSSGNTELASIASSSLAPLCSHIVIGNQKVGPKEADSYGTSIYFPNRFSPTNSALETINEYARLDFAKMTGWGDFLRGFLTKSAATDSGDFTPKNVSSDDSPGDQTPLQ